MKVVAALPPSKNLESQAMMLKAVFQGHDIEVVRAHDQLRQQIVDAEVLLASAFYPVTAEMIASAKGLKFIQVPGVGVDHIDLAAASGAGITVSNVTGANIVSVAEHVVMAALALVRGLVPAHNGMAAGQWPLPQWMGQARDLSGQTVGIVGMGRIGRDVAKRLLPFGVTILYSDQVALSPEDEDALGATQVELDDLLPAADVVTLHLPLTPGTRHLLNEERLRSMKAGAYLINTSRAEVVDEDALCRVLQDHLGGAALDVFETEPPSRTELLRHPRFIPTPHIGAATVEGQARAGRDVVDELLRALRGEPLMSQVPTPGARP